VQVVGAVQSGEESGAGAGCAAPPLRRGTHCQGECLRLRIWFRAVSGGEEFFFGEILMSVEISPCVGAKSRCAIEGVLDLEGDSMCLWEEVAPACANRALFFVVLVVPLFVSWDWWFEVPILVDVWVSSAARS
jgi:hypothetical protein